MKVMNAVRKFGSTVRNHLPEIGTGVVTFAAATAANADALADISAAADYAAVKTGLGVQGVAIAGVLVILAGIGWLLAMLHKR